MSTKWLGSPLGLHRHVCQCGNDWEHDGALMHCLCNAEFDKAHTCASCGTVVSQCHMPKDSDVDPTEDIRRERQEELNCAAAQRAVLEQRYGQVWNTSELTAEFDVQGFMAPLVVVRRKSDGQVGSLEFQHSPRFYFNYVADSR